MVEKQCSTLFSIFLFLFRGMDTSNPAVFVNAELLRLHMGRRVRAVIQVMRSDGGSTVHGRSTDDQQIIVKGNPPGPLTTFVEVIGIADSNQSIRAEIWSNFGDTLGITSNHSINIFSMFDYCSFRCWNSPDCFLC